MTQGHNNPSITARIDAGARGLFRAIGLLAVTLGAVMCAAAQAPDSRAFSPLGLALPAEGDLLALSDGRWLLGSERGLLLISDDRTEQALAGRYESLDVRSGLMVEGHSVDLIAAIDVEKANVVLFAMAAATDTIEELGEIAFDRAIPKALCLHRDPKTSDLALFTLDARGSLEQRTIYDGTAGAMLDALLVRTDVGIADAEACVVDDATRSLFIADEAFGVRRLDASEESDPIAGPWVGTEPFGVLGGEAKDLAIDEDGGLWILIPDSGRVYRRSRFGDMSSFSLPPSVDAAALAVMRVGAENTIAIFDENADDVWAARIAGEWTDRDRGFTELRDVGRAKELSVAASQAQPATITASRETAPVRRFGDAADDPAVLVARGSDHEPVILGTDKREGLAVYGLNGTLRQFLPVGRVNNVDVVTGVVLGDGERTIAAASNRSHGGISLFEFPSGEGVHLGDYETGLNDVYGLCMYQSDSGLYVFINDTSGAYEQYRIAWTDAAPTVSLVRAFALPSQPEGCAADEATQRIYMGEEAKGVWMAGAEPDGDAPTLVIPVSEALVPDVEGMDIYRRDGAALLVVSSQGSNSFAVYDLDADYRLVAHFAVARDLEKGIDGVSETDGLAVSAAALPAYPEGILVVQDGRNRMPDAPQNFKIIDWREVQRLLDQP